MLTFALIISLVRPQVKPVRREHQKDRNTANMHMLYLHIEQDKI